MTALTLESLRDELRQFAADRDWERFHTPRSLSMALAGEVGELLAELQWLSDDETFSLSPERHGAVELELADVLIYLVRLADVLDVDLLEVGRRKIAINSDRFPPCGG